MNKSKNYHLFALLTVLAVLFWEVGLCSDTVSNHFDYLGAQGGNSASFYTQAGNEIEDEACMPEQIGLAAYHANAGSIYFMKSPRGRNSLGKLLCSLLALLCILSISCPVLDILFSDSGILRNLSVVLLYIHDQDGKKRLH